MRINKYIAASGVCSRRKADELIETGKVKINGQILREAGYQVKDGDVVIVSGEVIKPVKDFTYVLLNKPKGVITSVKDDRGRLTVLDLLAENPDVIDRAPRLFPVGRLDFDTSGILLLTDDGDLTYRLTHPKHEFPKTYHALVQGVISRERELKLIRGVDIGGFVTSKARVRTLKVKSNTSLVEITIHEGKNRQVRKMFDAVGNPVIELKRVAFGEIQLGHLKEGACRKLTKKEFEYLTNI